ncbi:MAG: DUF192 domain-containing protein [Phycisphaerales bacterium]|nr:DUF192 domain-containing protein [Phycisphaerales bacterium]
MALRSMKPASRLAWLPATAILLISIISLVGLRGCDEESTDTFTAKLGGEWFTLDTAITLAEQKRGLGGRESIPDDGGMIFIFSRDEERNFWMLDCLVDMDIMYIDRTGFIVSTYTMKAQPLRQPGESQQQYEQRLRADSYPSKGRARYAIELRAGRMAELGLRRGQQLELDLDRLKELAASADDR